MNSRRVLFPTFFRWGQYPCGDKLVPESLIVFRVADGIPHYDAQRIADTQEFGVCRRSIIFHPIYIKTELAYLVPPL